MSATVPDPTQGLPAWLHPLASAAAAVTAEDLSRFLPPADGSGRPSAVLIALTDPPDAQAHSDARSVADSGAGPSVLLIRRAARMRTHAGQVAFPGGAVDASDDSHISAALREAEEEVGLNPHAVQVVAELPAIFLPPSGFVVTPVLARWKHQEQPAPLVPVDAREVAAVALVPVAALADPANRFSVRHPSGWVGPGFEASGLFIWGFTAGLIDRLLTLGGWARPWDTSRQQELPAAFLGGPPGPPVPG